MRGPPLASALALIRDFSLSSLVYNAINLVSLLSCGCGNGKRWLQLLLWTLLIGLTNCGKIKLNVDPGYEDVFAGFYSNFFLRQISRVCVCVLYGPKDHKLKCFCLSLLNQPHVVPNKNDFLLGNTKGDI